jgi:hypothetical protein
MTKKNAKKIQARARKAAHGGHYQHHLREVGGGDGAPERLMETLVLDPGGHNYYGVVSYVPPGLPNGAIDPDEGLIMGGIPSLIAGAYALIDPAGRVHVVRAERSAGGGAFMAVPLAPLAKAVVDIVYFTPNDLDDKGMPRTFVHYRAIPDGKLRPETEGYRIAILPMTGVGQTQARIHQFGHLAWRELLKKLDDAHPGLQRRVTATPRSKQ